MLSIRFVCRLLRWSHHLDACRDVSMFLYNEERVCGHTPCNAILLRRNLALIDARLEICSQRLTFIAVVALFSIRTFRFIPISLYAPRYFGFLFSLLFAYCKVFYSFFQFLLVCLCVYVFASTFVLLLWLKKLLLLPPLHFPFTFYLFHFIFIFMLRRCAVQ